MKKIGKIILFSFLILIFIGTFYFLWKKTQPKEIIYELMEPQRGDIEKNTVVTGKIEPRFEILIKPQISGIVTQLRKIAGDYIREGEVIAIVKVIPEIGNLNSAESRVNLAELNLKNEEQTFERQKKLHKSGVISEQEFQNSEISYFKAQEELANAKEALDIVKSGISAKYASYSNTQVRSTISGTILDIPIKVGNSVIQANTFNDGTTIAAIANMKDMIFVGSVDETEVGKLRENMPIILKIGAIQNQEFKAKLEYISPKGINNNGAIVFEIKAAATIPDTIEIRSGYSANADIILAQSKDILMLPERCIEFESDKSYVYILKIEKPKQEFEKREVIIGMSDGINIEIKSGIGKEDKVRGAEIDKSKKR